MAWQDVIIARGARIDPSISTIIYNDFSDDATVSTILSGTGGVDFTQAFDGGVGVMSTGATAGGNAGLFTAGKNIILASALSESWYMHMRVQFGAVDGAISAFASLSDASNRDVAVGLFVGGGQPGKLGLAMDNTAAGGGSTIVMSPYDAPVASTGHPAPWIDLDLSFDAPNGKLQAWVYNTDPAFNFPSYPNSICETTTLTDLFDSQRYLQAYIDNKAVNANKTMAVQRLALAIKDF